MRKNLKQPTYHSICLVLLVSLGCAANAFEIESGHKAKVKGSIVSRNGDLVNVREKKDSALVTVNITEATKIERSKGKVKGMLGLRHEEMDVTAMVPGLTVEAEGVGNAKGQLEASKISFNPDEFAIEVAEEQQITANQAAAKKAQSTANQGVAKANAAQSSANGAQSSADAAQSSANQAQATADAAGAVGVMDAEAVGRLNKRVSDLDDYKRVAEAGIYFPSGGAALDEPAKRDLDKLADIAMQLEGYMIEVAGYASSTGSKQLDQKLSSERAAAVTQYLREHKNVPMRRILAPAGYGSSHPDAPNTDPEGRALNRRVDITVLVNKGLQSN
jgi:outer membrane protein OmpA-like peptidoglycan-associated protein